MNVSFAREAICNASVARTVTHAWASPFGSPELDGNFDDSQVIGRKRSTGRIDDHRGFDTRIMWRVGRHFPVLKLPTLSCLLLTTLCEPPEIRRHSGQHEAGVAAVRETEQGSIAALFFQSCSMKLSNRIISTGRDARTDRLLRRELSL